MDRPLPVDRLITEGVTFDTLRAALAFIYFGYEGMTQEEWHKALEYVVPMQHNIMNPITLSGRKEIPARDTFIEYWIDDDDRLTQDSKGMVAIKDGEDSRKFYQTDECQKLARITVRFIGANGEAWAKLFHHLTKRPEVAGVLAEYCNAQMLEYIGPIRPMNVDYFGAQNTAIAYDIVMMLQYVEVIKLPGERLGLISIAAGSIGIGS
jgi:hypothetical protein